MSNSIVEAGSRSGFIHKSKLNNNGSFSVGKTWNLAELRGVEVVTVRDVGLRAVVHL